MNPETQMPPSRFPFFRRCFRAVFSRKMLYASVILITLIALFYAEENYRGQRAWESYRKDAEARGVKLDYAAHIPPPVPDAENGANTPLIQSWFIRPKSDDTNAWAELRRQETNQWPTKHSLATGKITIKRRTKGNGSQDDRFLTDFVAWQQAFARLKEPKDKDAKPIVRNSHGPRLDGPEQAKAAVAVLEELKVYEPALVELRAMSTRSKVHFPITYKLDEPFSILLPHLAKVKGIVQTLSLRACAELAVGQTNQAFETIQLMFWVCDSIKDEPFLISQLVRINGRQIMTQPIWEGITEQKWSDEHLKKFQERLLRTDFISTLNASLASERAAGISIIQWVRNHKKRGEAMGIFEWAESDSGEKFIADKTSANIVGWFIPTGWFHFEMANYGLGMDDLIRDGWEAESKRVHPRVVETNDQRVMKSFGHPNFDAVAHHYLFARLLLPSLTRASVRSARGQATTYQAALACAVERYRLAHGKYPDVLTDLVPKYLAMIPHEVVSDQPMRYQRTAEGFVLYSVGWDGVDDGGAFLRTAKDSNAETGDWVWRSAP